MTKGWPESSFQIRQFLDLNHRLSKQKCNSASFRERQEITNVKPHFVKLFIMLNMIRVFNHTMWMTSNSSIKNDLENVIN